MIASSLPKGEEVVDLLLKKEADVNIKSEILGWSPRHSTSLLISL